MCKINYITENIDELTFKDKEIAFVLNNLFIN